jgi:homopolymeric O-antigen transport system permease protein
MEVEPARRTLRPTTGWVALDLRELLAFKDLVLELARRDVKLRYRQTVLGVAWVVLQPLVASGVLYFAFGVVAGARPQQGTSLFLFTFAGLLAWNLFGVTLSKTSLSLVGNSYLISKVYFPRLVLPLSGTLSTLLDFCVSLVLLVVLLAIYGIAPGWAVVLLPVWIALILSLALGAGFVAAALTVDYRDIQHILPILIPFMLYASPVAYDVAQIPRGYQTGYYLINPFAGLIAAFRASLLPGSAMPPGWAILWSAALALSLFLFGAAVFRRMERKFADAL